jgi:branched-chain amino acid transport system substrate-binding protein
MMNRREFLRYAGAVPVALSAPAIMSSRALGQSIIRFGGVWSQSGPLASVGTLINKGALAAIEAYGEVLGNKLDYVVADDRSDPGQALRSVQEMMAQQGVKNVIGGTNTPIALALGKETHERRGVYVSVAGADEITGTQCNKSMFRWPPGAYSAAYATVLPIIEQFPNAKRWYTITGQYVFGDSLLSNTKRLLQQKGIEHIGNSYHSMTDREFSGIISTAMAARPDVIVVCNFGNQTLDILRQLVSFGAKRNTIIIAQWSTGLDQLQSLGADLAEGLYFGVNYWHTIDAPGNKIFSDLVKKSSGLAPSYLEACGYASVQMQIEGMKAANSVDPIKVATAMEGLTYEGATGSETIRAGDHQVLKPYLLVKGKARSAMKDRFDFVDIISTSRTPKPLEETGCKF